jgi:uncharacterized membrane protein
MDKTLALKVIAVVSLIGVIFSSYMAYAEMTFTACPASGCSVIAGIPACIYGMVMYLVVLILSLLGLRNRGPGNNKKNNMKPEVE